MPRDDDAVFDPAYDEARMDRWQDPPVRDRPDPDEFRDEPAPFWRERQRFAELRRERFAS